MCACAIDCVTVNKIAGTESYFSGNARTHGERGAPEKYGLVHETIMQSQPELLHNPDRVPIAVPSQMDRSPRLKIKVPSLCKQIMIIQMCFASLFLEKILKSMPKY